MTAAVGENTQSLSLNECGGEEGGLALVYPNPTAAGRTSPCTPVAMNSSWRTSPELAMEWMVSMRRGLGSPCRGGGRWAVGLREARKEKNALTAPQDALAICGFRVFRVY